MSGPHEIADRLFWYVGGRLGRDEAGAIERHLAVCEPCRDEAEALRSMFRSVIAQSGDGHLAAPELVAYDEGQPSMSDTEIRRIEEHLEECTSCKEDLDRLRHAAGLERRWRAASAGRARWQTLLRRTAGFLAPTAAVAIVAILGVWETARREGPSVASAVPRVVFATLERGPNETPHLVAPGPWDVDVLLPVLAPASSYTVRIRRAGGTADLVFEARIAADPDRTLHWRLPGLPAAGHFVLDVAPAASEGATGYLYVFDVVESR